MPLTLFPCDLEMWISSKNRRGVLGLGRFQREHRIGIDDAVKIGTSFESTFAKSMVPHLGLWTCAG